MESGLEATPRRPAEERRPCLFCLDEAEEEGLSPKPLGCRAGCTQRLHEACARTMAGRSSRYACVCGDVVDFEDRDAPTSYWPRPEFFRHACSFSHAWILLVLAVDMLENLVALARRGDLVVHGSVTLLALFGAATKWMGDKSPFFPDALGLYARVSLITFSEMQSWERFDRMRPFYYAFVCLLGVLFVALRRPRRGAGVFHYSSVAPRNGAVVADPASTPPEDASG